MPRRRAPSFATLFAFAGALLGIFSTSAQAATDAEPVRFAWVRGPGADACSSQLEIARQVTARLGKSPFAADAARTIDAYVVQEGTGFRAEIYVRAREGERAFARVLTSDAVDCSAVESAAVLALALAIDPVADLLPPAPAPSPGIEAPSPAIPPPDPKISSPPYDAAAPSPGIAAPSRGIAAPSPGIAAPARVGEASLPWPGASGVALRGTAGFGLLPRAALGVSLAAQVALGGRLALTAEALWMPEVSAADARFAFGLSALAIGACVDVIRARASDLALCGALWGGALHVVVQGLPAIHPGDSAWAAVSGAPRLRVRLRSSVHLELGAELVIPVIRRSFRALGWPDQVFQQAPLALLPFAGLGANFP